MVIPETFGSIRIRPIRGGKLADARLFRSCELSTITVEEATELVEGLGVKTIYDLRNKWEAAANPEPYILGTKTITVRSTSEGHRKNAAERLRAGVIGEYGAPEERMIRNYRKYARDTLPLARVLKTLILDNSAALIHCVNGKDRTGVISAVILRICGLSYDEVMENYLVTNTINKVSIAQEAEELSNNMSSKERAILMSFLEVRPAYLEAFFDEINAQYDTFERYLVDGLHLTPQAKQKLTNLV